MVLKTISLSSLVIPAVQKHVRFYFTDIYVLFCAPAFSNPSHLFLCPDSDNPLLFSKPLWNQILWISSEWQFLKYFIIQQPYNLLVLPLHLCGKKGGRGRKEERKGERKLGSDTVTKRRMVIEADNNSSNLISNQMLLKHDVGNILE